MVRDIDVRTLYTTYNDQIISKNLYYQGRLVGIWDARVDQVTIFKNESGALAKIRYDNASGMWGKIAYVFGGVFVAVMLLIATLTPAGFDMWMLYASIMSILL